MEQFIGWMTSYAPYQQEQRAVQSPVTISFSVHSELPWCHSHQAIHITTSLIAWVQLRLSRAVMEKRSNGRQTISHLDRSSRCSLIFGLSHVWFASRQPGDFIRFNCEDALINGDARFLGNGKLSPRGIAAWTSVTDQTRV
jgi:hypothetical protein